MEAALAILYAVGVLGVPGVIAGWLLARRVQPVTGALGYLGASFGIGLLVAAAVGIVYGAIFWFLPLPGDDGLGRGFLFAGMVFAFGFNLGSAAGTAAVVIDRRSPAEP
jgi:hypothetical protein